MLDTIDILEESMLDIRGVLGAHYNNVDRLQKLIDTLAAGKELISPDKSKVQIDAAGSNTQHTLDVLEDLKQYLNGRSGQDGRNWQNIPDLAPKAGETKAAFTSRKRDIKAKRKISTLIVDTVDQGPKELGYFTKASILTDTTGKSDAQEFGVCIFAACIQAGLDIDSIDNIGEVLQNIDVQKHLRFKESKINISVLKQLEQLLGTEWRNTWKVSAHKLVDSYPALNTYHFRDDLTAKIYNTYKSLDDQEFIQAGLVKKPNENKWNPADIWISDGTVTPDKLDGIVTLAGLNIFIESIKDHLIGVSLKKTGDMTESHITTSYDRYDISSVDIDLPKYPSPRTGSGPVGMDVIYNVKGSTVTKPVIRFRTAGADRIVGQLTGKYAAQGKIADLDQYIKGSNPREYMGDIEAFIKDLIVTYNLPNNDNEGDMKVDTKHLLNSHKDIKDYFRLEYKINKISGEKLINYFIENYNVPELATRTAIRYVCLQIKDTYAPDSKVWQKILNYCASQIEGVSAYFIKVS